MLPLFRRLFWCLGFISMHHWVHSAALFWTPISPNYDLHDRDRVHLPAFQSLSLQIWQPHCCWEKADVTVSLLRLYHGSCLFCANQSGTAARGGWIISGWIIAIGAGAVVARFVCLQGGTQQNNINLSHYAATQLAPVQRGRNKK